MKKWIALLLAVVMVLALSACGNKENEDASTGTTDASTGTSASVETSAQTNDSTSPAGGNESSSGDMNQDLPVTNADMEVDQSVPASDGDLTEG